jgi:hypothetical protein
MSKINQVENALLEQEGGAFQKVANALLHKRGYTRITTIGSVTGSDKTKKGTPDSYVRQNNGKIVFAEFTTDQTNPFDKIKADIEKCLDETKTGVSNDNIEKIIICHNSQLTPENDKALYTLCLENGVQLELLGLNTIAYDLVHTYPGIAKSELGIEIDSGQILDPEEFVSQIGKNHLTTPLDTDFYFREEELGQVCSGLSNSNVVMVTGPAGVGKSRLALKAMEVFIETNPGYKSRCILNKGIDLFGDSKVYFSEPGQQIVLIDDANRISQFDIILDILRNQRDDQSIKFVVTVRDYAKDRIEHELRKGGDYQKTELAPLDDKQISEMIKELFDIKNSSYLERITDIASGNPRLAIMAAKVALQHQTVESISDVTALYDEYFSSITDDLRELKSDSVLKVAGIISFFRSIDKSNSELMALISSEFSIGEDEFWKAATDLHNSEVVDIYEKEVVKINDQVYATYLFYLCFLKENVIDIDILFNDAFLIERSGRLRDSIYPCFNTFDYKKIADAIRPHVQKKWTEFTELKDRGRIHSLINLFWFLIQTDVLIYLSNDIKALEKNEIDLEKVDWFPNNISLQNHPFLEILSSFGNLKDPDTQISAIELAFLYAQARQDALPHLAHILFKNFGFDRNSWRYDYLIEKAVLTKLWEMAKEGTSELHSRVFIALAHKFLRIQHEDNESKNMTITMYRFDLHDSQSVAEIRAIIWNGLKTLIEIPKYKEQVLHSIQQYSKLGLYLSVPEIVEKDMVHLEEIISKSLDPHNLSHCIIVHNCQSLQSRKKIKGTSSFDKFFSSEIFTLFQILSYDYSDAINEELDYENFESKRKEQLEAYSERIRIDNFIDFMDSCQTIVQALTKNGDRTSVEQGIEIVLVDFINRNPDQSLDITSQYLRAGNSLKIRPWPIVKSLLDTHGPEATLSAITEHNYEEQCYWEFSYYAQLAGEHITSDDCDKLLELYKTSPKYEIPRFFDFLLNYEKVKKGIIPEIVDILIGRTEAEDKNWNPFDHLFFTVNDENRAIYSHFKGREDALERAYVQHSIVDSNSDYDSSMLCLLLQSNDRFLNTYFEQVVYNAEDYYFRGDSRDYSNIWELDNCKSIMDGLFKYVLERCSENIYRSESFMKSLFGASDYPKRTKNENTEDNRDQYLLNLIDEQSDNQLMMQLVFEIVSEFKSDRRFQFIEAFLQHNHSIEDFRKLSFEPSFTSASGSMVPEYQKKLDYWRSLLPLCTSLELIEHRLYIENRVDAAMKSLEREKKSDFMGADW